MLALLGGCEASPQRGQEVPALVIRNRTIFWSPAALSKAYIGGSVRLERNILSGAGVIMIRKKVPSCMLDALLFPGFSARITRST